MGQRFYTQGSESFTKRDPENYDIIYITDIRDKYSIFDPSVWWYDIPGYPRYQVNNTFDTIRELYNSIGIIEFPYGRIIYPSYISVNGLQCYELENPVLHLFDEIYMVEIEYKIKDKFPHYMKHRIKTCCNFDGTCRGPGKCIIKRSKLVEDELTPAERKRLEAPIEFIPKYHLWEGET